jgi:hypothetical protein
MEMPRDRSLGYSRKETVNYVFDGNAARLGEPRQLEFLLTAGARPFSRYR